MKIPETIIILGKDNINTSFLKFIASTEQISKPGLKNNYPTLTLSGETKFYNFMVKLYPLQVMFS